MLETNSLKLTCFWGRTPWLHALLPQSSLFVRFQGNSNRNLGLYSGGMTQSFKRGKKSILSDNGLEMKERPYHKMQYSSILFLK